jgi:hypothetical protein
MADISFPPEFFVGRTGIGRRTTDISEYTILGGRALHWRHEAMRASAACAEYRRA